MTRILQNSNSFSSLKQQGVPGQRTEQCNIQHRLYYPQISVICGTLSAECNAITSQAQNFVSNQVTSVQTQLELGVCINRTSPLHELEKSSKFREFLKTPESRGLGLRTPASNNPKHFIRPNY